MLCSAAPGAEASSCCLILLFLLHLARSNYPCANVCYHLPDTFCMFLVYVFCISILRPSLFVDVPAVLTLLCFSFDFHYVPLPSSRIFLCLRMGYRYRRAGQASYCVQVGQHLHRSGTINLHYGIRRLNGHRMIRINSCVLGFCGRPDFVCGFAATFHVF